MKNVSNNECRAPELCATTRKKIQQKTKQWNGTSEHEPRTKVIKYTNSVARVACVCVVVRSHSTGKENSMGENVSTFIVHPATIAKRERIGKRTPEQCTLEMPAKNRKM